MSYNPFTLQFTTMKGDPAIMATQQISAIYWDTLSIAHGKCVAIHCGGKTFYVRGDLDQIVANWQAALQSIAAGPTLVDFPGARPTWEPL